MGNVESTETKRGASAFEDNATQPPATRRRVEEEEAAVYQRAGLPPPSVFESLPPTVKFNLVRDLDRRSIQALCSTSTKFYRFCAGLNSMGQRVDPPVWDQLLYARFGNPVGAGQFSPLTRLQAHMYYLHLLEIGKLYLTKAADGKTLSAFFQFFEERGHAQLRASVSALQGPKRELFPSFEDATYLRNVYIRARRATTPQGDLLFSELSRGGTFLPRQNAGGEITDAVFNWSTMEPEDVSSLITWIAVLLDDGFEFTDTILKAWRGDGRADVVQRTPEAELVRASMENLSVDALIRTRNEFTNTKMDNLPIEARRKAEASLPGQEKKKGRVEVDPRLLNPSLFRQLPNDVRLYLVSLLDDWEDIKRLCATNYEFRVWCEGADGEPTVYERLLRNRFGFAIDDTYHGQRRNMSKGRSLIVRERMQPGMLRQAQQLAEMLYIDSADPRAVNTLRFFLPIDHVERPGSYYEDRGYPIMARPGVDIRVLDEAYLLFRRSAFGGSVYISAGDIRAAVGYGDPRTDEELEPRRPYILTPSREDANQTYLGQVYEHQLSGNFYDVDVDEEYLVDPADFDEAEYDDRAAYEAAIQEFEDTRTDWQGQMLEYEDYALSFNTDADSDGRAALATFIAHMLYDGWQVWFGDEVALDWIQPRAGAEN